MTDTQFVIKAANLEDVPTIVACCYKSYSEIGSELPKPNTNKAIQFMSELVSDGLVFLARKIDTNEIIGHLAMTPFSFWWTNETILHSVDFYVKPEYRKLKVAKELLRSAEEYASNIGTKVFLDIYTTDKLEEKEIFLRREGYNKVGILYSKG